jgi:hypothetical protein
VTSGYHGDCIARAKYRALEAEVQRLTDELAGEDDRIKAAASIAYQEGSESGLIDRQILITTLAERDATIARLTAEQDSGIRPLRYPKGPDGVCQNAGCGNATVTDIYGNGLPFRICESCYLALDVEGQEPAAGTQSGDE